MLVLTATGASIPGTDPALAEAREGLRARDLVDEVEVDREDRGLTGVFGDDVVVPDLLDEGPGPGRVIGHERLHSSGRRDRVPEGATGPERATPPAGRLPEARDTDRGERACRPAPRRVADGTLAA